MIIFIFTLRSYYDKRQKSASLRLWHENVRFQRNEWRSNVKANCHFK